MRWLGRTVLILLAFVAVAAPALWIGRDVVLPRAVQWAVNRAAGAEVIDALGFRVDGIGTGHVSLIDLEINRDTALTAERVRLEFAPRELLEGRLRTVTLTGPVLRASVGPDGGIRLGSLDAALAAFGGDAGEARGGSPPLRRLELRDAAVALEGGADGRLRVDGVLAPAPDGWAASLDWRLDAETAAAGPLPAGIELGAEGRLRADLGADGTAAGLSVEAGRLSRGTLDVDGLQGRMEVSLPAAGPPAVGIELSARQAAAEGVILPPPTLHLRYEPSGVSATARLGPPEDPALTAALVADPQESGGDRGRPFRIEVRADLARVDAMTAAWAGRPPLALRGEAAGDLAGSIPLDRLDPAAVWSGAVASGGLTLTLADAALPAGLGRARGTSRLAVALAAGRLSVETVQPATVSTALAEDAPAEAGPAPADRPPPDAATGEPAPGDGAVAAGLPEPLAALAAPPLRLALGSPEAAFRAMLEDPFGETRVELTGPAELETADGGTVAANGRTIVRRDGDGWALDRVERADLRAAGLSWAGGELERLTASTEAMTIGPHGPDGDFSMELRANAPDRGVAGAVVSANGRVAAGVDGVTVALTEPGRLSVERLAPATPLAPIRDFAARIAAGDRPVLTLPADGTPAAIRMPLDLPALTLESATVDVWSIRLQPIRVTVETALAEDAAGLLRARFAGASASVAPAGVTLEGLAADLRMELGADGARLRRIDVRARQVADQAQLARFTPLSLEGFARGATTARSPDRLAFRMTLRGADGAFVLDAEGNHVPSTGRGEADLTLFPIQFVPGGLQPADLSPAAAALFRGASGEVSLGGRVRWPGEAVPPDDPLTLTLKDLGFTGSLGTVTGLGGSVALSQVDPPATPPGQVLSATALDAGIPIVAPQVRFRLEPEGILRLESLEARFADGRVTAADVAIPLDGARSVPVFLTVEEVDAARLAEVVDLEGLSATGSLSGVLPLLWEPDAGLSIRQARLTTDGNGGSIRYEPEDGAPALQDSGEQVSLLLKAVRNFVYDSFEIEADGRPGEPFDVKLRLRGANPDLYDGYPIALNVTLTGALDELFGNLRRSLGLTDVVRRRLEASSGG